MNFEILNYFPAPSLLFLRRDIEMREMDKVNLILKGICSKRDSKCFENY